MVFSILETFLLILAVVTLATAAKKTLIATQHKPMMGTQPEAFIAPSSPPTKPKLSAAKKLHSESHRDAQQTDHEAR